MLSEPRDRYPPARSGACSAAVAVQRRGVRNALDRLAVKHLPGCNPSSLTSDVCCQPSLILSFVVYDGHPVRSHLLSSCPLLKSRFLGMLVGKNFLDITVAHKMLYLCFGTEN